MKLKSVVCFIILSLFYIPSVFAESKNNETPLDISISSIRTEAEKAAVGLLVRYVESVDLEKQFNSADPKILDPESGWLLDVSPEIDIQIGDEDIFNGLIAKLTGNFIHFDTIKVAGVTTPCSDCFFHVFPLSFGFESDRNFENVATLFELGYVPYFPWNKWDFGRESKVGIFLQAGYKIEVDNDPEPKEGGATNDSSEEPDSEIARIKLDASTQINLFSYFNEKQYVSFIPRIRLWYDIINSEVYHKFEASIKFPLGTNKSFDLKYENGSGAPNFNEGEQVSANISIKF